MSDPSLVTDTAHNGNAIADLSHASDGVPQMHMFLAADIDQRSDVSKQNVVFYNLSGRADHNGQ
jgi:hypothetical protein